MRNITIAILLTAALAAAAQPPTMMFYNVESLYDTLPSAFYDDRDYTPEGRYRWDTERYYRKIDGIASVVDSVAADLTALAEVENEGVVRDLAMRLKTDYNYIHRTSDDYRGMDIALLYKGDRFFPQCTRLVHSGSGRQFLYVRGRLCGERIDLVLCHLPSRLGRSERQERAMRRLSAFVDSLAKADTAARIVVAGDFNAAPSQKISRRSMPAALKPLLLDAERRGEGTIVYGGRWQMFDNYWVDGEAFADSRASVYIREDLLEGTRSEGVRPRRTFRSGAYSGGTSDHLPIILIFRP